MSPEGLMLLESGARVSSALIVGVFAVVAVRTVLQATDRRRAESQSEMDRLRGALEDLEWRVDRLFDHHTSRLMALEQRLDFTEQMLRKPTTSLEARH
jgi:hypothetical protein